METKIYVKRCTYCASEFESSSRNARVCPVCRSFVAPVHTARKTRKRAKSLNDFCREVEVYNRQNGTHLTYGQYSLLARVGASAEKRRV